MSRRVTRSMTTRAKPKRESDCSKEDSSAVELKTHNINLDALGLFGVLPTEIIEEILSYLPVKTISILALASSEWQYLLKEWLEGTRTIYRLSWMITADNLGDLADTIRRVHMSPPVDQNALIQWARNYILRLDVLWDYRYKSQLTLQEFGLFLRRCLKSRYEDQLCGYPYPDLMRRGSGMIIISEEARKLIHQLFNNEQLMLAAVDFITKGYETYSKAHFAISLFVPSEGNTDDVHLLAIVLNKWWKENEKDAVTVARKVLNEPEPLGTYRVAALLAKLDVDFAARLLEDPDRIQRVLSAMAEINGEATQRLLESLRKGMTDVDSNAVVRYLHHVVQKELNFVAKRCRRSFSSDLSDGSFELLHNLEIVLQATEKIFEEGTDSPEFESA